MKIPSSITDSLDEWTGAGARDATLEDLAFACSHDPALLARIVVYLKRESERQRRERTEEYNP